MVDRRGDYPIGNSTWRFSSFTCLFWRPAASCMTLPEWAVRLQLDLCFIPNGILAERILADKVNRSFSSRITAWTVKHAALDKAATVPLGMVLRTQKVDRRGWISAQNSASPIYRSVQSSKQSRYTAAHRTCFPLAPAHSPILRYPSSRWQRACAT